MKTINDYKHIALVPHENKKLRLSVLWNIPTACNRATADFLVSSPLMERGYEHPTPDLERYTAR